MAYQFVSTAKGYKARANAVAKLNKIVDGAWVVDKGLVRGTILANEDGTYSPAVFLTGEATILCRYFAQNGVYAIG